MVLTLVNVLYVLVAVAMIALILFQRGAGAAAGSGFGAGASATVFGARGASNFLSKSTAVLAMLFFVLSLGMAMYASRMSGPAAPDQDLGVMGSLVAPQESGTAEDGSVPVPAPQSDAEVPAAPAPQPAPADDVPAAPEATPPAAASDESDGNGN